MLSRFDKNHQCNRRTDGRTELRQRLKLARLRNADVIDGEVVVVGTPEILRVGVGTKTHSAAPRVLPPALGVRQELIDKSSEVDDALHDAALVVVPHGAGQVLVAHVLSTSSPAPQLGHRPRLHEPEYAFVASHPRDDARTVLVVAEDLQKELPQLALALAPPPNNAYTRSFVHSFTAAATGGARMTRYCSDRLLSFL